MTARQPVYRAQFRRSIAIAAAPERIWSALSDPARVPVWDTGIVSALNAPKDYPAPGQTVRWDYRLLGLPTTLIDRPCEVMPGRLLRTRIELAFLRFDETYTIAGPELTSPGARLDVLLQIGSTLPLIASLFDRWIGLRLATGTVNASLEAIKTYCEDDRNWAATGSAAQTSAGKGEQR